MGKSKKKSPAMAVVLIMARCHALRHRTSSPFWCCFAAIVSAVPIHALRSADGTLTIPLLLRLRMEMVNWRECEGSSKAAAAG